MRVEENRSCATGFDTDCIIRADCVDIPEVAFCMVRLVDSHQRGMKFDRGVFAGGYCA